MISRVEIIESESNYELQEKINKCISRGNVKDIKFCVNPEIHGSYGSSYSSGEMYYAMIIYEE